MRDFGIVLVCAAVFIGSLFGMFQAGKENGRGYDRRLVACIFMCTQSRTPVPAELTASFRGEDQCVCKLEGPKK